MVHQPLTGNNCKYIQSILLNLSMGDKQNGAVTVNSKNDKANTKMHIYATMYLQIHYTHITHVY